MAAELLRLFIVEARLRAAIEVRIYQQPLQQLLSCVGPNEKCETFHLSDFQAECENEGTVLENSSPCDDNGLSGDSLGHVVSIRADHISKVAAELLMDFS